MELGKSLAIRIADSTDFEKIWPIFKEVVGRGDTYSFSPEISKEEARVAWMGGENSAYVASIDDRVVGTYILKSNQPGLGSHVANAAFMIDPAFQSKGYGKRLAVHALSEAKRRGFKAMQFNFVVSTNEAAVSLWKRLGFSIVGKVPNAFEHSRLGLVDALIMYRSLDGVELL